MKTLHFMIATVTAGLGALMLLPMISANAVRANTAAARQIAPLPPIAAGSAGEKAAQKTEVVIPVQAAVPAAPAPAPAAPVAKPAVPEPPRVIPQAVIPKKDKQMKAADAFFIGPVVKLDFVWEPEEWEYLKRDNRRYAECKMTETQADGTTRTYKGVAVKLKGAAGSFRGPDDKPGLTVSMDKYKGAERFHGMEKFHLNNGAQDGSLLNEMIGGDWCRAAEVPASRCTHVLVKWNGRELGLYLLKESFTRDFLSYFYDDDKGSLYDGHFISEVDGNLEKQLGDPADRSDLQKLADAAKKGSPQEKWAALEKVLDVEQFLRSLAMESITGHWDGYNFNRNNYRVYFDAKTGKANFFCHGMDQILGDPNFPVIRDPGSLVGSVVWANPAWKTRYREILEGIYYKVLKERDWNARIAAQGEKIITALEKQNPQWAKDYRGQIAGAQQRVSARIASVGKQLGDMPKPFKWTNNVAKLGTNEWRPEGGGAIGEATLDGQKCFHIRSDGSSGSWRRSVALEPGRYRFEANVRVANVEGPGDQSGEGAGLRISGGTRTGANGLKGSSNWQKVAFEFDAAGSDVVLIAELRSAKGEAWFQHESLQIVKLR